MELAEIGGYSYRITTRLYKKMVECGLDEIGSTTHETLFLFDTDENLRRRPDVAFVSQDRWSLNRELSETGDWEVIPNLSVEVISPHDLHQNVIHTRHEYFQYDVREGWQVLPEDQQVHIYESPDSLTILRSGDVVKIANFSPTLKSLSKSYLIASQKHQLSVNYRFRTNPACLKGCED